MNNAFYIYVFLWNVILSNQCKRCKYYSSPFKGYLWALWVQLYLWESLNKRGISIGIKYQKILFSASFSLSIQIRSFCFSASPLFPSHSILVWSGSWAHTLYLNTTMIWFKRQLTWQTTGMAFSMNCNLVHQLAQKPAPSPILIYFDWVTTFEYVTLKTTFEKCFPAWRADRRHRWMEKLPPKASPFRHGQQQLI